MEKITCKHCGTKYSSDVAKCPNCGASNLPSISEGFDFLDDDFEAKPAAPAETPQQPKAPETAETPEAPEAAETPEAPEAPEADETPEAAKSSPVTGDTGRYNWEDIIAEIHGQESGETQPSEPTRQVPPIPAQPAAPVRPVPAPPKLPPRPAEPEEDDEPAGKPKKGGSGLKVALIILLAAVVLAAAAYGLKRYGVFDKSTETAQTPTLPVTETQNTACTGITLSSEEITLTAAGASQMLTPALQPSNTTEKVNWVSADPSVATVDANGKVTAVAEGKANILASCGSFAATCKVTVAFAATTQASTAAETTTSSTGLSLNLTDITMSYPGELAQISVNNAGDSTVTWSSENENIVTVNTHGLVTAKGTGTTHVIAQVGDEKLSCIVRCPLGGEEGKELTVSLNKTDISMFNAGESFKLEVTYAEGAPAGTTQKWTSSDEKVCTVDENGVVTAVGNGTAYVSTVADGVTLKCVVRVTKKA